MKKLFLLLFFAISALVVNAQTEKGRCTVGANIGDFTYYKQGAFTNFSINVSPQGGYLIADNLLIGSSVPFSFGQTRSANDFKGTSFSLGLAPFIRYYFLPGNLKPYVGMTGSYSVNKQTYSSPAELTAKGFTVGFAPELGIAYFINRSIALNGALSYNVLRGKSGSVSYDVNGNRIEPPLSTTRYALLAIGFQLFLGK